MNSPCNEASTSELTNVSIVSARQFAAAGWGVVAWCGQAGRSRGIEE